MRSAYKHRCFMTLLVMQAVSCVAQQKPSFTYTGPTQPGWGYASPLGLAVVWFSADETLAPGTSAGSYLTSPGGQVVDVISGTAGSVTIRGYVPATDAFASNTTSIELSTQACGLQAACTATAQARNAPRCNLYAVDLSYSGSEGLITDKDSALLIVGCSSPVTGLCFPAIASCIYVDGPANATTDYVSETTILPNAYYSVQVAWDAAYLGPVIVSIDCELTEAKSTPLGAAIPPLNFSVRQSVPVRSTGYSLGAGLA